VVLYARFPGTKDLTRYLWGSSHR